MTITTPASTQWLNDGTAPVTASGYGKVGGAVRTIDLGSDTEPYHGVVAFNTSALYLLTNQVYLFELVGSTTEDFSGDVQALATWSIRAAQQDVRPFSNVHDGVVYQYVRHRMTLSGTTPSITSLSFVRSLEDLDQYTLAELISIQVLLCSSIKDAATMFRAWMTGVAWGGPNGDGKYALSDGIGNVVYTKCPAQLAAENDVARPEYYGAIGDGNSHPASGFYDTLAELQAVYPFATSLAQEMDFLGWQKAIYSGLKLSSLPNDYVMCNTDPASHKELTVVSGQGWVEANRARLDFRTLVAKTTDEHLLADYNFVTGAGCANATVYAPEDILPATFNTGAVVMTDTGTGVEGQKTYFQWSKPVTLTPGRYTVTAVVEATRGASYDPPYTNPDPPYCIITFWTHADGSGDNPVGRDSGGIHFDVFKEGGVADVKTVTFDINVSVGGTAYVGGGFGGYGNFKCTKLDIQPALLNCAVLMTRDNSPDHYPIMQPVKGLWIVGPGDLTGITGVLWKSFENIDGNVSSLEMCNVTDFEHGLETSDGAYLVNIVDCNMTANGIGYRHRPGSVNAGENIRFERGGITNGRIGILNDGGAEINIDKTAIDYNIQAITENTGIINGAKTRIEQWTPTTSVPIFHCKNGGRITFSQVYFLGAGGVGSAPVAPIQLDSALCAMTWDMCTIYNLSSATGFAKSGPGRLDITRLQNNGNPNIGPFMLSDAPAEDVLNSAGLFEPPTTFFAGQEPSAIFMDGGLFGDPAHTQVDRWNTNLLNVSISNDYGFGDGTHALKVSKLDSDDLSKNDSLHLIIPTRCGNLLGGFKLLLPNDCAIDGAILYVQQFWVNIIGHDALGRPIYGRYRVFKGETNVYIPLVGSTDWMTLGFGTLYQDDTPDATKMAGIRPPAWANGLQLVFDHESIPAMDYYVANLKANEVG